MTPDPLAPMEAKLVASLPGDPGWQFEPKWDGFRALVFRDRSGIEILSKSGKSLGRYFPEIVAAVAAVKCAAFTLDGELILPVGDILSFDATPGPASSRREPRGQAFARDPGPADAVRLPGAGRGRSGDRAAGPAPGGTATLSRRARRADAAPVGTYPRHRHGPVLAGAQRRCAGRRGREAARRTVSGGGAGDAQGEAASLGRLRGRRISPEARTATPWPRCFSGSTTRTES